MSRKVFSNFKNLVITVNLIIFVRKLKLSHGDKSLGVIKIPLTILIHSLANFIKTALQNG